MKLAASIVALSVLAAVALLVRLGQRDREGAVALLTRHPSWVDEAYDAWDGERVLRLRPDPYVGRLH